MLEKILIVDDSSLARQLLRGCLPRHRRYELFEASDGRSGVEMFKQVSPDLTFMDLNMPEMDGLQATEAIRRLDGEALVIVVTAEVQMRSLFRALELGAMTLLRKPASATAVADVMARASDEMHRRRLHGRPGSATLPMQVATMEHAQLGTMGYRVTCQHEGIVYDAVVRGLREGALQLETDATLEIQDEVEVAPVAETPGYNSDALCCRVIQIGDGDSRGHRRLLVRFNEPHEVLSLSWVTYILSYVSFEGQDERRQFRRFPTCINAEVVTTTGVEHGQVVDLSPGGLALRIGRGLSCGQAIRAIIGPYRELGAMQASMLVRNCRPDPAHPDAYVCGLSFGELDQGQVRLLGAYLRRLQLDTT